MLDASDSRCSTRWGDNGNVDKPKCLLGCTTSSKYAVDENAESRCFTRRRPGIKTKESRPTNGFQLGAARCRSARPAICGIGKEMKMERRRATAICSMLSAGASTCEPLFVHSQINRAAYNFGEGRLFGSGSDKTPQRRCRTIFERRRNALRNRAE